MAPLFDPLLRARRRDRAAHASRDLFLVERAFDDCLDRLGLMNHRSSEALLVGCPDPAWKARLGALADGVEAADPGPAFAIAADGQLIVEDHWRADKPAFDLIVAVGTLDTVNDLPVALRSLAAALRPGGLFIGAMSGGDTLPLLRSAMAAADQVAGHATPHVHPRIEPSALAPLLEQAGLTRPVVDVDRVLVRYASFGRLVRDLRGMAATNILLARSKSYLGKSALRAAEAAFVEAATNGRAQETFELLHFAAWKPER